MQMLASPCLLYITRPFSPFSSVGANKPLISSALSPVTPMMNTGSARAFSSATPFASSSAAFASAAAFLLAKAASCQKREAHHRATLAHNCMELVELHICSPVAAGHVLLCFQSPNRSLQVPSVTNFRQRDKVTICWAMVVFVGDGG